MGRTFVFGSSNNNDNDKVDIKLLNDLTVEGATRMEGRIVVKPENTVVNSLPSAGDYDAGTIVFVLANSTTTTSLDTDTTEGE